MSPAKSSPEVIVRPLTSANWPDMGKVLGVSGDGGCWCMWWRLSDDDFEDGRGEGNKQALQMLVDAGKTPGVIAYLDGQPAGWCAIGARSDYPRLLNSGLLFHRGAFISRRSCRLSSTPGGLRRPSLHVGSGRPFFKPSVRRP